MSPRWYLPSLWLLVGVSLAGCGEAVHRFPTCEGPACREQEEPEDTGEDASPDGEGLDVVELGEDTQSGDTDAEREDSDAGGADAELEVGLDVPPDLSDVAEEPEEGPCPSDMALVEDVCMDLYEAPNVEGEVPLVMYHLFEAEEWCEARGKRLCYDDEWTVACGGPDQFVYPYGNTHDPGVCNDEETWIEYIQGELSKWPNNISEPTIGSLDELLDAASSLSTIGDDAADEVARLYQGEPAGANAECVNQTYGVYDLVGNVEEWTLRSDAQAGGDFLGNLKGRYWAESRTCQGNVRVHGNVFRFYEIGFRCCMDPE